MTKTVQPCSQVLLNNADKELTREPQTETPEDNLSLLLSVFDSLNNLYEKLSRLDYVIKRKNMELSVYHKNEGVNK